MEVAHAADLVIAAGGDDHFKYVTHYLNATPVFGLNTDPSRAGENYWKIILKQQSKN